MARKWFDYSQLGAIGRNGNLGEEEAYTADGRWLTEDLAWQIGRRQSPATGAGPR